MDNLASKTTVRAACGSACCWHMETGPVMISGGHSERCCHCGASRFVPRMPPPIPAGHGPFYPYDGRATIMWCNTVL